LATTTILISVPIGALRTLKVKTILNCTYLSASYILITIKLKAKYRFLAVTILLFNILPKYYRSQRSGVTVAPTSYVCMSAMLLLPTAGNHNARGCDDLQLNIFIQDFVKIGQKSQKLKGVDMYIEHGEFA
jgi:hypothetical protein